MVQASCLSTEPYRRDRVFEELDRLEVLAYDVAWSCFHWVVLPSGVAISEDWHRICNFGIGLIGMTDDAVHQMDATMALESLSTADTRKLRSELRWCITALPHVRMIVDGRLACRPYLVRFVPTGITADLQAFA